MADPLSEEPRVWIFLEEQEAWHLQGSLHVPVMPTADRWIRWCGSRIVIQSQPLNRTDFRTDIVDTDKNTIEHIVRNGSLDGGVVDCSANGSEYLVLGDDALSTRRLIPPALTRKLAWPANASFSAVCEVQSGWEPVSCSSVTSTTGWRAEIDEKGRKRILIFRPGEDRPFRKLMIADLNPDRELGRYVNGMVFTPDDRYLILGVGMLSDVSYTWEAWDFRSGATIFPSSPPYRFRLRGVSSDSRSLILEDAFSLLGSDHETKLIAGHFAFGNARELASLKMLTRALSGFERTDIELVPVSASDRIEDIARLRMWTQDLELDSQYEDLLERFTNVQPENYARQPR